MSEQIQRREILRMGLGATSLIAVLPGWAIPALAQGETIVPFTDIPPTFNPGGDGTTRLYDIRNIDGLFTPNDEYFSIAHYGMPELDPVAYRLQVTGLVNNPMELSLADIRSRPSVDVPAGYECSGNSARSVQGLSSCGNWTGARVRDLLGDASVTDRAREVLFFGADRGEETTAFRQQEITLDSQFIRSVSLQTAMESDAIIAYELNGQALGARHGAPARLIMPGWYGVSNVKWLANIHIQQDRYLGKFQARWYRTLRGEMIDGEMKWKETAISRLQLKSVIARITRTDGQHKVLGFVLNDGTPLESVEVKVDDGPWERATMDPSNTKYSWKLFTYDWRGATAGEHTIVSRVTDVNGQVQPVQEELETKRTFLEDNSQYARTVRIT